MPDARPATRALWWLIGGSTVAKMVLAFTTYGNPADIGATARVAHKLIDGNPFDVYGQLQHVGPVPEWPYPPGFFPFALLSGGLARLLPGHFDDWIHVAPILADGGIALVVQRLLARQGLPARTQLAGAAIVALGPLFVATSAFDFQIDSVAVLPGVIAVAVWDGHAPRNRAVVAGLLIGVAASVKWPLGLLLFAVLPTARSGREAAVVAGCAGAVPLTLLAPFLIADASTTLEQVLGYTGVPGHSMLSVILRPELTSVWVTGAGWQHFDLTLMRFAPLSLAVVIAGVVCVGVRFRTNAQALAVVLWLGVWALSPGFFFRYMIWGLPFLVAERRLGAAVVLQVAGVIGLAVLHTAPWGEDVLAAYRVLICSLFAFTVYLLVRSISRLRAPVPLRSSVAS